MNSHCRSQCGHSWTIRPNHTTSTSYARRSRSSSSPEKHHKNFVGGLLGMQHLTSERVGACSFSATGAEPVLLVAGISTESCRVPRYSQCVDSFRSLLWISSNPHALFGAGERVFSIVESPRSNITHSYLLRREVDFLQSRKAASHPCPWFLYAFEAFRRSNRTGRAKM